MNIIFDFITAVTVFYCLAATNGFFVRLPLANPFDVKPAEYFESALRKIEANGKTIVASFDRNRIKSRLRNDQQALKKVLEDAACKYWFYYPAAFKERWKIIPAQEVMIGWETVSISFQQVGKPNDFSLLEISISSETLPIDPKTIV